MSELVEWLTKILDEDEARLTGPTFCGPVWPTTTELLATIAAKRASIARCAKLLELAPSEWEYFDAPDLAMAILHDMATAYADRPGYHFNGWRP